ncbi:hypothetical protein M0O54_20105, partial [Acinetobacter lactucae]
LRLYVSELKDKSDFSDTSKYLEAYRDFCEKARIAITSIYPELAEEITKENRKVRNKVKVSPHSLKLLNEIKSYILTKSNIEPRMR